MLCINKNIIKDIKNNKDDHINIFRTSSEIFFELEGDLKIINKRLSALLSRIKTPDFLFSKKGYNYSDNNKKHLDNHFIFKVVISDYLQKISYKKVFRFFYDKFKMPPDIANLFSDIVTVDGKLPAYASTNSLLSYFVNEDMFNDICNYISDDIFLSIYKNNITLSSKNPIDKNTQNELIKKIKKFGYQVTGMSVKYYEDIQNNLIIGVIYNDNNESQLPKKMIEKMIDNDISINNLIFDKKIRYYPDLVKDLTIFSSVKWKEIITQHS